MLVKQDQYVEKTYTKTKSIHFGIRRAAILFVVYVRKLGFTPDDEVYDLNILKHFRTKSSYTLVSQMRLFGSNIEKKCIQLLS